MLIATITVVLLYFGLGSGGLEKEYESVLKDVVHDEARYEQVMELVRAEGSEIKAFQEQMKDVWAKDWRETMSDFDATEEQFRALADRADASRRTMQDRVIDSRMKMAGMMSEREWSAMFSGLDRKAAERRKK